MFNLFKKKDPKPAPVQAPPAPKAPENVYEFLVKCADEKSADALAAYQKDWTDPEDKHEGMTLYDLKDSCRYGEKIYEYPPMDVTPKLKAFIGDDGSVTITGFVVDGEDELLVGEAAKTKAKKILKILQEESPSITAELFGGQYWKMEDSGYVDDRWSDPYTMRVKLKW